MGAYLNWQTALSYPLWTVVTHTRAHTHTNTHTLSLTEGSDIHSHTGRHPLSFENTQSPFTLQNPHTPRPVCLGTLHQRTQAHAHARSNTHARTHTHMHTLHRGPLGLIAPPFGWCHLFHTFCQWLTESCSELVVLWGRMMEALVRTCWRLMSWPETLLSIYLSHRWCPLNTRSSDESPFTTVRR